MNANGETPPSREPLVARVGPEPIDPARWYQRVLGPESGAVAQFCGTVRNHHGGAQVVRLEYEAYQPMAEDVIRGILQEARTRWGVARAACVHRTGTLELGEVAVCVTVATDHRAEAFSACAYIINRLKEQAPIWKRETLKSGDQIWIEEGGPDRARGG